MDCYDQALSKSFQLQCENCIIVWLNCLFVYIFVLQHKSAHLLERWDISRWVDFFLRHLNFKKVYWRKFCHFLILMSKHTFIFVVYQPNVKYLIFPINERIYVVIQKCKKITQFFRQLCHSQIVVEGYSSTQREISHLSNKWADFCSNTKM